MALQQSKRHSIGNLLDALVVLVAVDALGFLVLLVIDQLLVGRGEVAVVLSAHGMFLVVDGRLLFLEVLGFTGGELTTLDALANAVLLVFLALVDGGVGGSLGEERDGGEGERDCESNASDLNGGSPCVVLQLA